MDSHDFSIHEIDLSTQEGRDHLFTLLTGMKPKSLVHKGLTLVQEQLSEAGRSLALTIELLSDPEAGTDLAKAAGVNVHRLKIALGYHFDCYEMILRAVACQTEEHTKHKNEALASVKNARQEAGV